jgi:hypothetical protein
MANGIIGPVVLVIPFKDEETANKFFHHLVELTLTYVEGWVQSIDASIKENLKTLIKRQEAEERKFIEEEMKKEME